MSDDRDYFVRHATKTFEEVGLSDVIPHPSNVISFIEGHKGQGYGVSTDCDHGE